MGSNRIDSHVTLIAKIPADDGRGRMRTGREVMDKALAVGAAWTFIPKCHPSV